MITVRLKGGLGNQLFQYALGRALSLHNKTDLGLDVSFYDNPGYPVRTYDLDLFTIHAKVLTRKEIPFLRRSYGKGIVARIITKLRTKLLPTLGTERGFAYNEKIFTSGSDLYLDGYWQSYKYFQSIEDIIRHDLTLSHTLPAAIESLRSSILSKKSVCVHVRRGDYVGNQLHDTVDRSSYYKKALKLLPGAEAVYVFSDDIEWCTQHLSFDLPTIYVGPEYAGMRDTGHFALMQVCTHFIIANSSFSWWAAWLGKSSDKKVIAPKQWFIDPAIDTSDLIPKEWIRI